MEEMMIFPGNASKLLTEGICKELDMTMGKLISSRFSDGETRVEITDNVRSQDIFVVQSTCALVENGLSVNDDLMELLIILDALKRSSAKRITAVIPYFGYARQDKKDRPRMPISAALVAKMIEIAGANRVISMDLHSPQIQGYFNIPVDNLFAKPVFVEYFKNILGHKLSQTVVVSPDAGGVQRARAYAKALGNVELALIDKRRDEPNEVKKVKLVGSVKDKVAILVDDMVDTANTMVKVVEALKQDGALEVYSACTHPVFSGQAIEKINSSGLSSMIVGDTIPLASEAKACDKIKVVSVVKLLAKAIDNSHRGKSVSSLFE